VVSIRLNRPEKLNAITRVMLEGIRDAVTDLDQRDDLHAMLITAEGRYFSSGIDIIEFMSTGDTSSSGIRRQGRELRSLCDQIEAVEKPVVLSAQGPCWGAALELSLSCDFRFASEFATFALPEIRLGLVPSAGGTSRLTRLVGTGWAKWLCMGGRIVSATDARMMGLVHEVYPADALEQSVGQVMNELVALPVEAVGLAKIAIGICAELGGDRGRDVERMTTSITSSSEEFRQRVTSFKTKSPEP
jgi:enoyl-CoA hydratase/carnithine racemase